MCCRATFRIHSNNISIKQNFHLLPFITTQIRAKQFHSIFKGTQKPYVLWVMQHSWNNLDRPNLKVFLWVIYWVLSVSLQIITYCICSFCAIMIRFDSRLALNITLFPFLYFYSSRAYYNYSIRFCIVQSSIAWIIHLHVKSGLECYLWVAWFQCLLV